MSCYSNEQLEDMIIDAADALQARGFTVDWSIIHPEPNVDVSRILTDDGYL